MTPVRAKAGRHTDPAVGRAGGHGEMWFGFGPLTAQWVLDDVRRTLIDSDDPLDEADAVDRLRALVAATT